MNVYMNNCNIYLIIRGNGSFSILPRKDKNKKNRASCNDAFVYS